MSSISHAIVPDTIRFRNKADFNVKYNEKQVDTLIMLTRYGELLRSSKILNKHLIGLRCIKIGYPAV